MKPRSTNSKSNPSSRRGSADFHSLAANGHPYILAPIEEINQSNRNPSENLTQNAKNDNVNNNNNNNSSSDCQFAGQKTNSAIKNSQNNGNNSNLTKIPFQYPWNSYGTNPIYNFAANNSASISVNNSNNNNLGHYNITDFQEFQKFQDSGAGRRKSTGELSFRSDVCNYEGSASCTPNGSEKLHGLDPPIPSQRNNSNINNYQNNSRDSTSTITDSIIAASNNNHGPRNSCSSEINPGNPLSQIQQFAALNNSQNIKIEIGSNTNSQILSPNSHQNNRNNNNNNLQNNNFQSDSNSPYCHQIATASPNLSHNRTQDSPFSSAHENFVKEEVGQLDDMLS